MKQFYRLLPLVISISLLGCDSTKSTEVSEPKPNSSESELVSKLPATAPIVKVGTEGNYAPYEFKGESGKLTGFDIELLRYIGEEQGFKVEVYKDTRDKMLKNLDSENRDIVAAGLSYSADKAEKYLLSDAYAPLPNAVVYFNDSINITSLSGLSQLRVGVLEGSGPYDYFTDNNYNLKSLEQYPSTFAAIEAMAQKKIDVVADDSGALRYTLQGRENLKPKYFNYENINADGAYKVFLIDKKQPELLSSVNSGLKTLKL